jgi:hypothetical protein
MTKGQSVVRLPFQVDPQPISGFFLVRCEALDLVCQGPTPEAAQAQLQEEAALYLGAAKELGTLGALTGRLASLPVADAAATVTVDLSSLL